MVSGIKKGGDIYLTQVLPTCESVLFFNLSSLQKVYGSELKKEIEADRRCEELGGCRHRERRESDWPNL